MLYVGVGNRKEHDIHLLLLIHKIMENNRNVHTAVRKIFSVGSLLDFAQGWVCVLVTKTLTIPID